MSVYPDKKGGKHTGRWCVEVQKDGQRLRGRFDTHDEATAAEAKFLIQLQSGTIVAEAKRKFNSGASRPRTLEEGFKRAEATLWRGKADEASSLVRLWESLKCIGLTKGIDEVSTEDIDALVDYLQIDRAGATVNRYLSALSKFMKWCVDRDYRTVKLPVFAWQDEDEGRIRWITHEEELELLSVLRGDVMPKLVKVAIQTGMRRSELLGIDSDNVTKGWAHLWQTKADLARSVPLTDESYSTLKWVLRKGFMPNIHQLRYEWNLAREAMGLTDDPWFVFHACRHTCATRYVQANVNLRVIQKLMGHKRIETTLRYAHVNDTMLTDALGTLEAFNAQATNALGYGLNAKVDAPPHLEYRPHDPAAKVERPTAVPAVLVCGRGGTGRRAGFRFQYRKMWGFESLRPHQLRPAARAGALKDFSR